MPEKGIKVTPNIFTPPASCFGILFPVQELLWNYLEQVPGMLRPLYTPGAVLWEFGFSSLGETQSWFVVLPCSKCSVTGKRAMVFLPACPQHLPTVSVPTTEYPGFPWLGPRIAEGQMGWSCAGTMKRQFSWENVLLGAARLCVTRASPRLCQRSGRRASFRKATSSDTLRNRRCLCASAHADL